jgi:PEP-CTERM motif
MSRSPEGGAPEPSTWAMLLLGFAGVGFIAYRRRKSLRSRSEQRFSPKKKQSVAEFVEHAVRLPLADSRLIEKQNPDAIPRAGWSSWG